ncbi:enoyl-CoA hydratase-related protein [Nocardioides acrostichi]|uniref:Enoyl-CoA hydratase/isomerase family protein n=1 Tax=Nocardioides acrostichi TaxID=2784339 RepID=A0A930UWA8_9ACTN|nr:enoyl-CoA hydratase-related protein [Nocardioides acrostichi]MBF4160842.1 enoyl-CoA hydratase/isomerase family protein [Nocardioides acrostichi]
MAVSTHRTAHPADVSVTIDELDPATPVLVGVGEASERIDDPGYAARSECDLAAMALREAVADICVDDAAVLAALDLAAMTRSFDQMSVGSPFGQPTNFPWAVLRRVGAEPALAIYERLGGETPQSLVNELAARIAAGESEVAAVFGADITSTTRHITRGKPREKWPDFSEQVDAGPTDDHGRGTHRVNSRHGVLHGMTSAPAQFAVMENARRHRLGLDRATYRRQMAELFAPLSEVAASNPHSASPEVRSVEEVGTVTDDNRLLFDPYLRLMVARDQVNQGAAVVLMSVGRAQSLGVDPSRWVFLHGHASLAEKHVLARPDLSRNPAAGAAFEHAMDLAGPGLAGVGDLVVKDIYSCFPVAVTSVTEPTGIDTSDPRTLTVTGGLPYFGGAGSNYSLHGIAGVVRHLRADGAGGFGVVSSNGGMMSKCAVGVYSTTPAPWVNDDSKVIQAALDAAPDTPSTEVGEGPATVEAWAVQYLRGGGRSAIVVARDLQGRRFLALGVDGDEALLDRLDGTDGTDDPVGTRIHARRVGTTNRVALTRRTLDAAHPVRRPRWDRDFERLVVSRDDHVLHIALDRPDDGNALDQTMNTELEEVVAAYLADPELWVAVLEGRGSDFCVGHEPAEIGWGNTLVRGDNGVGGITRRTDLEKPLVAAVHGRVLDEGLELMMACHLVVAADDVRLALTQARRGLIAEEGGLVRLPRQVGSRLAFEMVLTGRRLDAGQALAAGLLTRCVPASELGSAVDGLVGELLSMSPTSLRASLRLARAGAAEGDPVAALRVESDAADHITFSQDLLIGLDAARSGGDPEWGGV